LREDLDKKAAMPVSITVSGLIFTLQNVVPGAYIDSITATVTF